MANRKRPIVLRCPVTAEERELIERKMAQLPTQRIGAYLRKMAIDGYIIYTDTTDIKVFIAELSSSGKNINQIAKRINADALIYQTDTEEIKERLDEIWQLQRHILSNFFLSFMKRIQIGVRGFYRRSVRVIFAVQVLL